MSTLDRIQTDLLDSEVQYQKGMELKDAGQLDKAIHYLEFASFCDPQNGVYGPRHQFLLKLWDAFHDAGIEIPYPQRDVHLHTVAGDQGTPQER